MESSWGRFFRQFHKDRGLSLEEATQGADCAPSTLSRFERGLVDVNVANISKIMGNLSMNTLDVRMFLSGNPEHWRENFINSYRAGLVDNIAQQARVYIDRHQETDPLPSVKLRKLMYTLASTPPEKLSVDAGARTIGGSIYSAIPMVGNRPRHNYVRRHPLCQPRIVSHHYQQCHYLRAILQ